MSEAPAIGLGVVLVAIVAVLAAGAGGQDSSASGSSASGSSASGSSAPDTPLAPGARSTGPCTGLDTVTSGGGDAYVQYPVSASNSLGCTLTAGDHGEQVAALQRALALCMHRKVSADGVYGAQTARIVNALGGAHGGYGPAVAGAMSWPWFSAGSRRFTGRCSAATS
jgi:hypothetical protein